VSVGVIEPIDLRHEGAEERVGCYLLDTAEGLALFDCGPASTLPVLEGALAGRGLDLDDVQHLLLSHIHLDHAGAAGAIVRDHPHVQVHVSAIGAPHLVDPERLEASARRLYGDAFDTLWGELIPVPRDNVHVVGDAALGLDAFPTPGHASHHVSYLDANGTLYSGDAAGVRLPGAGFVLPPLPPPEIDLDAWEETIAETERRAPTRLALVHFGVHTDVEGHLQRLRSAIHRWSEWVAHGMDEETFCAAARADVAEHEPGRVDRYAAVVPFWHCYRGLERYWRKRSTP
jgi:glyoxylase-like metal-dependent hydrolase (beta-lactamase superfamily II)